MGVGSYVTLASSYHYYKGVMTFFKNLKVTYNTHSSIDIFCSLSLVPFRFEVEVKVKLKILPNLYPSTFVTSASDFANSKTEIR